MRCPICGEWIDDDAEFCDHCGVRLDGIAMTGTDQDAEVVDASQDALEATGKLAEKGAGQASSHAASQDLAADVPATQGYRETPSHRGYGARSVEEQQADPVKDGPKSDFVVLTSDQKLGSPYGYRSKPGSRADVAKVKSRYEETSVGKRRSALAIAGCIVLACLIAFFIATEGLSLFSEIAQNDKGEAVEQEVTDTEQEEETVELTVKDGLSAYSWAELDAIADLISACDDRDAAIAVGQEYNLIAEDGTIPDATTTIELSNGEELTVRLIDIYHDTRSDGTVAGLTFLTETCVGTAAITSTQTNAGGWEACDVRAWLQQTEWNLLPEDLTAAIAPVLKETNNEGHASSIAAVTQTEDTLWLISVAEIFGEVNWSGYTDSANAELYNAVFSAEGMQYAWFAEQNEATGSYGALVRTDPDTDSGISWWLRSPSCSAGTQWRTVGSDGTPWCYDFTTVENGIVFGFCL